MVQVTGREQRARTLEQRAQLLDFKTQAQTNGEIQKMMADFVRSEMREVVKGLREEADAIAVNLPSGDPQRKKVFLWEIAEQLELKYQL